MTAAVALRTSAADTGAVSSAPSRNAISGSTLGWMNRPSSATPSWTHIASVSHPWLGCSTPIARRIASLVNPSLPPTTTSPSASRSATPLAWTAYASRWLSAGQRDVSVATG